MLFDRSLMISIISIICICLFSSFALASTPVPILRMNFDGNFDAVTANGTIVQPLQNDFLPVQDDFQQGVVGPGVELKTRANYIRYNGIDIPSEDFTVMYWYKDTGVGSYSTTTTLKHITLYSGGDYVQIDFRYTATKQPYMWRTTFAKGSATTRSIYLRDEQVEYKIPDYAPNVWHCIGLTFDYSESLATFYMDGIAYSTLELPNFNLRQSSPTYVMIGYNDGSTSMRAIFDEISIYDTVLTAEEIQLYYLTKGIEISPENSSIIILNEDE